MTTEEAVLSQTTVTAGESGAHRPKKTFAQSLALFEGRCHWVVPVVFFGLTVRGMNLFAFALTFKAYGWPVAAGIERVFYALGSVQIVNGHLPVDHSHV
ncbi:Uu.00g014570.m01.CDS01 [Anthostomella pinea]|uniref:Uu.00g014570.m01.CDS01 n=1 Tax=Anthostomella pinea TaxID=933095 RepID=A0AAI8YQB4_9PEZI|nr:Uu.00g014570.m01.CDS01 [Anthostomella pinea]